MAPLRPAGRPGSTIEFAGAPAAGTSEVQTLTVTGTPTGGTFKLKFRNRTTAAIAYNANAAAIQSALEALSTIGTGNVAVTGTGPFTITFQGTKGKQALPTITLAVNALTGGTTPSVTIVKATPGADVTARGAGKGTRLADTTNGKLYINTGTAAAPVWTVVGTQT